MPDSRSPEPIGEVERVAVIDWLERALAADYTDGDSEGVAALETALAALRQFPDDREQVSGEAEA